MKENKSKGVGKALLRLRELCNHKQRTIRDLRVKARKRFRTSLRIAEDIYKKTAEEDSELSYVVVAGSGKIIASTDTFRRKFKYGDIEGRSYFSVFRIPEHAPDYMSSANIRELFRDPQEREFHTLITDGKGKERYVSIVKSRPHVVYFYDGQEGERRVGRDIHPFTRVTVLEVGKVRRVSGGIRRVLHIPNGEPASLVELLEKQAAQRIEKESKKAAAELSSQVDELLAKMNGGES